MAKFLGLSGLSTLVTNIKNWANNRFALTTSIPTKISQLNNEEFIQVVGLINTPVDYIIIAGGSLEEENERINK